MSDTLDRLCADTSDWIPVFLLPVVRENLARGGEVEHAAAVVAAWARYAEGVDEQGAPIVAAYTSALATHDNGCDRSAGTACEYGQPHEPDQ